ncbi:hypothetical protein K469DRAFT_577936 [Zopfia rhizophila CBS 207.26]|uniref:Uncharacterized protein n=1 Tax=Zopfia rhizophila CBS 207.26 TaxID=1314779 RepID=A0A6A6DZN3_9PEZI|nr:hypothetical protein K469DRAFT_577936 [Zopfia rhizophila CBS 207.26]
MGKPGFGLGNIMGRRKSSGNAMEDVGAASPQDNSPAEPTNSGGGFRVLGRDEVQKAKQELALKKQQQEKHKFGRFSGFGASGNKARNQSFDEDSPSSSKRDSKSSSGTSMSRPYNSHTGHYGSTSTLPSSADTDPNDNMFANLPPRSHIPQHSSSPNTFSMSGVKKALPLPPKSRTIDPAAHQEEYTTMSSLGDSRPRAMTTSSYASTAVAPKLETDLNFDKSGFDDLFSGLERKNSPDFEPSSGRSLLAGKRTFQAEPIKINRELEVDPPPKSWDSRGSGERLIASPTEDHSPPPPVPPHKYTPVASESPNLRSSGAFEDEDAKLVRQSFIARKSIVESSPEQNPTPMSSSSAPSLQTPLSSRSASNNTTPKAALHETTVSLSDDEDDNLFAPRQTNYVPQKKPAAPVLKENVPPPPSVPGEPGRRVITLAEFRAQKEYQMSQPAENSSDSEDYEDEEEAIQKREQEELAQRKRQQMQLAREHLRRSTTAPGDPNRPSSRSETPSMGFPSETSLHAADWEDEDIPLGILYEHSFPGKGKPPAKPPNAAPSYFLSSTPGLPERPASAGAASNRVSQAYRPPFARNLPADPHASFIGGDLVQQGNRESMGFNRSAASVHGDSLAMTGFGSAPTMPQFVSLVDQIQLKDMQKAKYTGGASSKTPQSGPFTGALGSQMNGMNSTMMSPQRMSQMPMQGMNPMMGMNQPMMGMMGMNQMNQMNSMGYPMQQQNPELLQMQQIIQMQQMQLQQMSQMNRMSMIQPNPMMNQNLGLPNMNQRPMSIASNIAPLQQQQQRPLSTPGQLGTQSAGFQMPANNGYTPSIAPSERSNIGLSARYRPVVTGNQDGVSTISSTTLQASGGAEGMKVKGILKKPSPVPQIAVGRQDDEDDWGGLEKRKNKFGKGKQNEGHSLQDLVF